MQRTRHERRSLIAVMRAAGSNAHGLRVRALIAVIWRRGAYLQGIDPAEIIEAVHSRRAPATPVEPNPIPGDESWRTRDLRHDLVPQRGPGGIGRR
jgi:hypothetical protein